MNNMKCNTLRLAAATLAAFALGAGALWWGAYDVGADAPHTRPVYALLEFARERSVAVRADAIEVPALEDERRIRNGAGNYQAMCAGCHLAPGMTQTELSRGLYPAPPDLSKHTVEAAQAFWTIKHGIKASGMPAWGPSMGDAHLWDLVAFVGKLPSLDAARYRDLVARSGGHSHGGGETHSDGEEDHSPMPAPAPDPAATDAHPSPPSAQGDPSHAASPPHAHAHDQAASPPPQAEHAGHEHRH
ncbi:c-type cytochrome [Lysobacter sp. CA199]|uniref:c-type cytochrome n=1 Tax=Lysobacter sp. CA199 TaxID=3455608 RepID=UPI003F8D8F0C